MEKNISFSAGIPLRGIDGLQDCRTFRRVYSDTSTNISNKVGASIFNLLQGYRSDEVLLPT